MLRSREIKSTISSCRSGSKQSEQIFNVSKRKDHRSSYAKWIEIDSWREEHCTNECAKRTRTRACRNESLVLFCARRNVDDGTSAYLTASSRPKRFVCTHEKTCFFHIRFVQFNFDTFSFCIIFACANAIARAWMRLLSTRSAHSNSYFCLFFRFVVGNLVFLLIYFVINWKCAVRRSFEMNQFWRWAAMQILQIAQNSQVKGKIVVKFQLSIGKGAFAMLGSGLAKNVSWFLSFDSKPVLPIVYVDFVAGFPRNSSDCKQTTRNHFKSLVDDNLVSKCARHIFWGHPIICDDEWVAASARAREWCAQFHL